MMLLQDRFFALFAASAVVGLAALLWVGDTRTNEQAGAEMGRRLREMGVAPWIDTGRLTVHRNAFGSFASDPRYARLDLATPASDAVLAAVEKAGWTLVRRQPTSMPSEFDVSVTGMMVHEFESPQKNDHWWFYTLPKSSVIYINNSGS